jgi:hypothetical protein
MLKIAPMMLTLTRAVLWEHLRKHRACNYHYAAVNLFTHFVRKTKDTRVKRQFFREMAAKSRHMIAHSAAK